MDEKTIIELINQLFEIDKKAKQADFRRADQYLKKANWLIETTGYKIKDPIGEQYDHTRTDCEATILKEKEPYIISETLKPAIYFLEDGIPRIVQLARVIIK